MDKISVVNREPHFAPAHGRPAGREFGYTRVSTAEQVCTQLEGWDLDFKFHDVSPGGVVGRPGLDAMISLLVPGDTVFVAAADRLSRSYHDIRAILDRILGTGAKVMVIDDASLIVNFDDIEKYVQYKTRGLAA